jgi:ribosomal protein L22
MSPERKKKEEQLTADSEQLTEDQDKAAEEAQEKPKPKRTRRKKKEEPAEAQDQPTADSGQPTQEDAEAAKEEAATEEAEAEQAEAEGEPEPEDEQAKPKGARGAEATAGRRRRTPRREPGEPITVRAKARYVRCAPRKARLVVDHIRGKSAEEARAILVHTPRAASRDVLKLLDSAIANAESNHELGADELRISKVFVDEGPTLKRFRPRALGRATRIRKRTSHMTIHLTNQDAG